MGLAGCSLPHYCYSCHVDIISIMDQVEPRRDLRSRVFILRGLQLTYITSHHPIEWQVRHLGFHNLRAVSQNSFDLKSALACPALSIFFRVRCLIDLVNTCSLQSLIYGLGLCCPTVARFNLHRLILSFSPLHSEWRKILIQPLCYCLESSHEVALSALIGPILV